MADKVTYPMSFRSAYIRAQGLLQSINFTLTQIILSLLLVFVTSKIIRYWQNLRVSKVQSPHMLSTHLVQRKAVSHIPGLRVLFHPLGLPGVVLPTTWWNPGYYFLWAWRDTCKQRHFSLI